jgi:hypothetical protein
METDITNRETLHATVFEIERGLFYATYHTNGPMPTARRLPPYQVGSSLSDAKARIELRAQALGYETIVWETQAPPAMLSVAVGAAADHPAH